MKYGVVPAGGLGSRMSHLGYSKELLPVGGIPVIEYILARLMSIKVRQIFVTSHPDKADLNHYLTHSSPHQAHIKLILRERLGLLDGIVSPAENLTLNDELYFGLPDTIWYPANGFAAIMPIAEPLVLGLLPSDNPSLYGSVVIDKAGSILKMAEKPVNPVSPWIWAFGKIAVKIVPDLVNLGERTPQSVFTEVLGKYCAQKQGRGVPIYSGRYLDVGIPANLTLAEEFLHEK